MSPGSFWLHRPSRRRALAVLVAVALLGLLVARLADRWSPLEARANLPLTALGMRTVYLTSLAEDPARVLLTTRRENSTWTRDAADQRGDPYWIRRYGDPARPGLCERILLTSRSRGAHFLIPLTALDLRHALAVPSEEAAGSAANVRTSLAEVFLDRAFAGVFLELRFPERPEPPAGAGRGEPMDFDLVVVRGNRVRTTDFLLQPNGRFYRAAIAEGRLPSGTFLRNGNTGDELVFAQWESPEVPSTPLFVPIPLFDELALCWGTALPTLIDDRWRSESLPAFAAQGPSDELRLQVTQAAGLQLDARLESAEERRALTLALERWAGS